MNLFSSLLKDMNPLFKQTENLRLYDLHNILLSTRIGLLMNLWLSKTCFVKLYNKEKNKTCFQVSGTWSAKIVRNCLIFGFIPWTFSLFISLLCLDLLSSWAFCHPILVFIYSILESLYSNSVFIIILVLFSLLYSYSLLKFT